MGFFFKSKRSTKNSSDNNITITNQNSNDIKTSIDLMFSFIKEMKRDIKADMKEINEEIRRTARRIDNIEGRVSNAEIRIKVIEKTLEGFKRGK